MKKNAMSPTVQTCTALGDRGASFRMGPGDVALRDCQPRCR